GWESEPTYGFANATGFELKSQAINRRQRLSELPAGLVEKLYDDAFAQAGDYELLRFAGRTPDELIDEVARLTAAINDAPLDDLEMEDEAFPPERIRAYETAQNESGFRFRRVVARHRATGELAGHTVVTVDSERPTIGDQHDTAVAGPHRGHRLGVLLKADMVRWLATDEPQLETIDTWNAESNDHMVFVNELLGYRIMGRELNFQRRI
ncbi:MAG: GNAT family N-acetyltransferase, partial [Nocardioides sp.]